MKGKIIKYLLQKLVGKEHNGIIIAEDMILATRIEHFELNVNNNPTMNEQNNFVISETKTIEIVANPYETHFIML